MLSIREIPHNDIDEYYTEMHKSLTRYDVQYLMDLGRMDLIKNNNHYRMLRYLNDGVCSKPIKSTKILIGLEDYTSSEIVRLLEGPLKERCWNHIRCLYLAGFRDEVFKHYTGDITPQSNNIDNEDDMYEYIVRLLHVKYCDEYDLYFHVWYNIDPSLVIGHKLHFSKYYIDMLKNLGVDNLMEYLNPPEYLNTYFNETDALYYILIHEYEGICPYDKLMECHDLDSSTIVEYFRHFKKHGIHTDERYYINLTDISDKIMEIIDNVDDRSLIKYYIKTGTHKEYIREPDYKTTYWINPNEPESMDRILEGYIRNVIIDCTILTDEYTLKRLKDANININIELTSIDLYRLCIATHYCYAIDIVKLDLHSNVSQYYKLIMYPNALISIWNKYHSMELLGIISKYAPNVMHNITIPDKFKKYCKDTTRRYSSYIDVTIVTN